MLYGEEEQQPEEQEERDEQQAEEQGDQDQSWSPQPEEQAAREVLEEAGQEEEGGVLASPYGQKSSVKPGPDICKDRRSFQNALEHIDSRKTARYHAGGSEYRGRKDEWCRGTG